jgi:tRNA modification GTPase
MLQHGDNDTIAGLATTPGRSEVGIVRISGDQALQFVQECFGPDFLSGTEEVFYFFDQCITGADPVPPIPCRVFVMKAPHSYTREDVVEFHVPGAPQCIEMFLSYCQSKGIRMPEPGEFTRRAFLNGRINLIEAMGVIEVITAADTEQLNTARSMLFGQVADKLAHVEGQVRELLSLVEVSIDFSEDDIDIFSSGDEFAQRVDAICVNIESLAERKRVRDDMSGEFHMIIAGMVNAGKSTLFNRLMEYDRCAVSGSPGTTRDLIRGELTIEKIPFVIYDTAGLTVRPGVFEKKARNIIRGIGLDCMGMLLLISPEIEIPEKILSFFLEQPGPEQTIVVGTKGDLGLENTSLDLPACKNAFSSITISGSDEGPIQQLKKKMADMALKQRREYGFYVGGMLNNVLERCKNRLTRIKTGKDVREFPELVAEDLRDTAADLGVFSLDDPGDDVLNRIFSSFCIGK